MTLQLHDSTVLYDINFYYFMPFRNTSKFSHAVSLLFLIHSESISTV